MKPPTSSKIAYTMRMDEDGVLDCNHCVTDGFGLMQWDGMQWDEELKRHIPSLTPMYSDLTLLSNPNLPDAEAEAILREFFQYILKTRREAVAAFHQMQTKGR